MEYCIVYLSSSTGLLSQQALARILEQSQQNNRALGVTGLLVYCNGSIIQVLEGPEEQVKILYQTISRDNRHNQLIKLYSQPIESRSFSDWSMAYRTVSASEFSRFNQLIDNARSVSPLQKQNSIVLGLVRLFYENNYRN